MPVIHSAKKKMRHDKWRTNVNKEKKEVFKKTLRLVKLKPTLENLRNAQSIIDKTAKARLIHKNKAARLKSQLSKLTRKSKTSETVIIKKEVKAKKVKVKKAS